MRRGQGNPVPGWATTCPIRRPTNPARPGAGAGGLPAVAAAPRPRMPPPREHRTRVIWSRRNPGARLLHTRGQCAPRAPIPLPATRNHGRVLSPPACGSLRARARLQGARLATVSLRQVRKTYDALEVVHGVDLEVADEEFVVLVGPSGCGKSTLLRMIAGLEEISGGEIAIGERRGQRRRAQGPRRRDGVPGLRALSAPDRIPRTSPSRCSTRDVAKAEIARRVARGRRDARASSPCSTASRGSCRAGSASGWRWAARSCASPRCSCSTSRCRTSTPSCASQMRTEIKKLRERVRTTTIYVTHDQIEAMTLADRDRADAQGPRRAGGHARGRLRRAGDAVRGRFRRRVGDEPGSRPDRQRRQPDLRVPGRRRAPALPPARYDAHARQGGDDRPAARAPALGARTPTPTRWSAPRASSSRWGRTRWSCSTLAGCELQARLPPRVVRHAGEAVRVAVAPESIHLFDPVTERRL